MSNCRLRFELRSFWHPGTGRGAGSALDALVHRDSGGLPVLPGRTVKGLLRDAVFQASAFGWYGDRDPADVLFGWRPAGSGDRRRQGGSPSGALRVSDASLPAELAGYLSSTPGRELIPGLFQSHFGTAVDHESGTAKEKSLRGFEVAVPLELTAQVAEVRGGRAPADWCDLLRTALPLLRGVGAHRNRGLGRVLVTLEEDA